MKKNAIAAITAGAVLAGCGTPWPLEKAYSRKELVEQSKSTPQDYSDIDSVKSISNEWQKEMGEAARDRRKQEILVSDLVFYGTVLLSAGQAWLAKDAVSKTALRMRNVGVGTAAGAGLLGNHYQPRDQRLAFSKAEERMACLNRALSPIPTQSQWSEFQTDEAAFKSLADKASGAPVDVAGLYIAVPQQALEYIETYVLPSLKAELADISLASPSRDDMLSAAKKYTEQREAGASAVASAASAVANTASKQAFANETDDQRSARLAKEAAELLKKQVALMRRAAAIQAITSFSGALSLCKVR